MENISITIPKEIEHAFEQELFDVVYEENKLHKNEAVINGRNYVEYKMPLEELNPVRFNVVKELYNASSDMEIKGYNFDYEIRLINRGLRGNLTQMHVIKINDDNPETYVARALKKAFTPIENYTDASGTTLGFKKTNEFEDALRFLLNASKPDFNYVADVDKEKIYENDKKFIDEETIEAMIETANVDITTAHLMRQQLSKMPNVAEHVYYIYNNFFLGWMQNKRPDIGTWIDSCFGDNCYLACRTDALEACFGEWWDTDVDERYGYYAKNRR